MGLTFEFSETLPQSGRYFSPEFLREKWDDFSQTINNPQYGFFKLTDSSHLLQQSEKVFQSFKHKKHFVHVGIGGSSLGTEMLIKALKKVSCTTQFYFLNNIDPDLVHDTLYDLPLKETLFYVVSKSGGTAETCAHLAIICKWLEKQGISPQEYKDYLVFCTDPEKGDLRSLSQELNINTLPVPQNIGGRYSVLSPVGLFPALFADIPIQELYEGANKLKEEVLKEDLEQNPLFRAASALMSCKQEKNISQTVLMPYSSKLFSFTLWFVQLWAESLGKAQSKDGKQVFEGLTPIPAVGATDQHSQAQLFRDGPQDKFYFFIQLENFEHDYSLKNDFPQISLQKLKEHSLQELMTAEFQGTRRALEERERPSVVLGLKKLNAESLGQLILFFESLTVLMGSYLNVDPFNQPGVEAGKKYAFEWLENNKVQR